MKRTFTYIEKQGDKLVKEYTVAVVGATGAVGTRMIKMLEQSELPIKAIKLLASARSAGKTVMVNNQEAIVEELTEDSFKQVDFAFFSAGGALSKKYAPIAVDSGAIVIDNTSHFRMEKNVPLVVPEVNPDALYNHQGIIANPNCSTIQMMVALEPIRKRFGLKRVVVSTYQAVGGAGMQAIEETENQFREILNNGVAPTNVSAEVLPVGGDKKHFPMAFNALPQIDLFTDNGYTYEEMKMINETKKIMEDDELHVAATCVRVPVLIGHSESVYIEVAKEGVSVKEIQEVLSLAPGVVLQDNPSEQVYPQAIESVGKKETFVGRVRKDLDVATGFHMWIVSDNLLKGAAWNSIQIAETMVKLDLM